MEIKEVCPSNLFSSHLIDATKVYERSGLHSIVFDEENTPMHINVYMGPVQKGEVTKALTDAQCTSSSVFPAEIGSQSKAFFILTQIDVECMRVKSAL